MKAEFYVHNMCLQNKKVNEVVIKTKDVRGEQPQEILQPNFST